LLLRKCRMNLRLAHVAADKAGLEGWHKEVECQKFRLSNSTGGRHCPRLERRIDVEYNKMNSLNEEASDV